MLEFSSLAKIFYLFRSSLIFFRAGRKNAITLRFVRGQRGGGRAAPQGQGQCGVEGLGMFFTAHVHHIQSPMKGSLLLFALQADSTTLFFI